MTARREKNGTYTSQFWYEDIYGKRRHKCKRGFATEEEADAFEEAFLRKARGSMEMKLADFVDVYLEDVKADLREYTLRTRLYIINDKVIPELGCKRMKDIETVDIIQWQNKMLSHRRPNGSVSVNVTFTIFTNVFSPIAPTRMRRIRQRGCAAFGA